ncbi:hypothetical protein [uncultured Azonexus sp.]|uniref:hypothetical protein n=1 Tax=uncultured Azonexus sp. TaxID=520307 RepID=UPI0026178554|nr:hypothetical protein [uncultured Azonexus sp.]
MTQNSETYWQSAAGFWTLQRVCVFALMVTPGLALAAPGTTMRFSEVNEQELSTLRGRFARDGQIINFGIEMLSQWQKGDGTLVSGGVNLQVDAALRPTLTVTTPGQAVSAVSAGGSSHASVGAMDQVQGVAQSIQIAGDGNAVSNGMQIDIVQRAASAQQGNAIVDGPGTYSRSDGAGSSTVKLEPNSLSLLLEVPGQGRAIQRLSARGLLQSTVVGGDLNRVSNQLRLTATVAPSASSGMSSANYANLRGLALPGGM